MSQKGTSKTPLVLGIIGGVLGIPGALCSPICAIGNGKFMEFVQEVQSYGDEVSNGEIQEITEQFIADPELKSSVEFGGIMLWVLLISGVLGLIGGILGKSKPSVAGILMLIAAVVSIAGISVNNYLNVFVGILFLIGGIICFKQEKEDIIY